MRNFALEQLSTIQMVGRAVSQREQACLSDRGRSTTHSTPLGRSDLTELEGLRVRDEVSLRRIDV